VRGGGRREKKGKPDTGVGCKEKSVERGGGKNPRLSYSVDEGKKVKTRAAEGGRLKDEDYKELQG